MRLSDKRWKHPNSQKKHQPRRGPRERDREGESCNNLRYQPPHLLNHSKPVRSLDTRPFKAVVEDRILIRSEIQPRRLLHNAHTDILRIAIGQQRVGIINRASNKAHKNIQPNFATHQYPKARRKNLSPQHIGNIRDDELRDLRNRKRQNRHNNAKDQPPDNHRRARVPKNPQHWRNIAQRPQAFEPRTFSFRMVAGIIH